MDPDFEKVELTEEEMKAAILEGRKKKYFKEKHKGHWPPDTDSRPSPPVLSLHICRDCGTALEIIAGGNYCKTCQG